MGSLGESASKTVVVGRCLLTEGMVCGWMDGLGDGTVMVGRLIRLVEHGSVPCLS